MKTKVLLLILLSLLTSKSQAAVCSAYNEHLDRPFTEANDTKWMIEKLVLPNGLEFSFHGGKGVIWIDATVDGGPLASAQVSQSSGALTLGVTYKGETFHVTCDPGE